MRRFHVPDMSCGHCKAVIEKAVLTADGQAQLAFDLDAHEVRITSEITDHELLAILAKEGYPATILV
ncbi:heavy-metal-associated domain-containing protein [Aliiroseovarius sp. PrR006]|uniref:heavy-metal-associated domain-containing protein n=1 Tax=Aliiroseovarius sp. PrR006 TaxID=2706883 RepID=UPI0013D08B10|nr:heavy-metal-associated domain-containing protein [Aliiroseovarius sp. PrR006]NDW54295.1 heavy-metal-associated domain-containing protein [Aliiroseovarius sp. PrR006]